MNKFQKQLILEVQDLDPAIHIKARGKIINSYPDYFSTLKEIFFNELKKEKPDKLLTLRFLEIFAQGGIDREICDYICGQLEVEKDNQALARMVSALAQWEDESILPVMEKLLQHEDSRIVSNVIEVFGELGNKKDHAEKIRSFLKHPHHRVKTAAIIALWTYGEYGILDIIQKMLKDPNFLVQRSAHFALGKMAAIQAATNPFQRFFDSFFLQAGPVGGASQFKEALDRDTVFSLGLYVSQRFLK
ncbi:HEAT repeat domain-containing protein [Candidatus Riflebacteria bacterium]